MSLTSQFLAGAPMQAAKAPIIKQAKEHEFGCENCGCYTAAAPKCPHCEDYGIVGEELEAHRSTRGF